MAGNHGTGRGWRRALHELTSALEEATDQELLLARGELADLVAQLSARLRGRGLDPTLEATSLEDASMAEVIAEDLRHRGYASHTDEAHMDETEEASLGRMVAEELRQASRRRRTATEQGEVSVADSEENGSLIEDGSLPEVVLPSLPARPDRVQQADAPQGAVAGGEEVGDEVAGEDGEQLSPELGEVAEVDEEVEDQAAAEDEEGEDEEGEGEEEEEADDDLESSVIFGSTKAMQALRSCLQGGNVPTEEEVVQLFDLDALPDGEDMVSIDTSSLGEGFEEDAPKAARALVARLGPGEAARLAVAACEACEDAQEDVSPPAKQRKLEE